MVAIGDNYYLGLDIGGTTCATLLARANPADANRIVFVERGEFATRDRPPEKLLRMFADRFKEYILSHSIAPASIGISCGGPLDFERGAIMSPPNLPGWNNVPIVDFFKNQFDVPVYLENDANAGALAESIYGAGIGKENIVFLTFGTGLGAGLILNNHLVRGASNMAGEVGHIRLSDEGPLGYRKNGSFEGFCSGGGIVRLALMVLESSSQPSSLRSLKELTAKTIGDEAAKGDPLAMGIYQTVGTYLGRGLAVLIDLLNPETIIIGGIFPKARSLIENNMRRELEKEALPEALRSCSIVPSKLSGKIGDYEAVTTALKGLENAQRNY